MNKQLTAKAPRYSFFSIKKHPHHIDWYTKNRNDQAFHVDLFSVYVQTKSNELRS